MTTTLLDQPAVLEPDHLPDDIVDREEETRTLTAALADPGSHLHLYGRHGSGKTLMTRTALADAAVDADTCVLSCTQDDTQYKVLAQLAATLTGTDIGSGYHTAQLQDHLAGHLPDTALVIVLDDVDFLLCNRFQALPDLGRDADADHVLASVTAPPALISIKD